MKKIILTLLAMVFVGACFAQDIVVKKDGSTIQTKIIKVRKSEVDYKMYNNLNGPTYTISIKELQCINYENGTKDTFVPSDYNPDIVTNENATQFSNDKKLLDIYNSLKNPKKEAKIKSPKKEKIQKEVAPKIVTPEKLYKRGKRMKVAGFTIGSTLLAAGIATIVLGTSYDKYRLSYDNKIKLNDSYRSERLWCLSGGGFEMLGAVVVAVPLISKGSSLQKKNREYVHSVSAISHDIHFNNGSSLNLGVDVLSSNIPCPKTPGIGIRYNF